MGAWPIPIEIVRKTNHSLYNALCLAAPDNITTTLIF